MHTEKIVYRGWQNCYRLSNHQVDLIVTADVGPRIIRFGFVGQPNQFKEFEGEVGKTGGDEWRSYGGHRLWHAPEAMPRSYAPDNYPVEIKIVDAGLHAIQPVEAQTGIQKEMEIFLDEDAAHVMVLHRLRNLGVWSVELAAWCLTVMEPGGTAIMPLPPRGSHPENLLPTSILALWAYTDLTDPRLTWGRQHLLVRQDSHTPEPLKIGASVPDGWVAYARVGQLFVKKFEYQPEAIYPDMGCSFEVFTNHEMLEIETLSPLVYLDPGDELEYYEDWYLLNDVKTPKNDVEVIDSVLPRIKEIG